jgi:prepilin-type N-terminal cleavage/methylation domain-containing protein
VISWMKRRKRLRLSQRGFTLIETLIIVAVLGVLTAIAAPSFLSFMDSVKINQTIAEVRGILQEGQRQAIRSNQPCMVAVSFSNKKKKDMKDKNGNTYGHDKNGKGGSPSYSPAVALSTAAKCPSSSDPELPDEIDLATNIATEDQQKDVSIVYGIYGSAEFGVVGQTNSSGATPKDPSGKIIAYAPDRENVQKKCIAVSSTLGLTRVGNYTGGIAPEEITKEGVCTALDWTAQ